MNARHLASTSSLICRLALRMSSLCASPSSETAPAALAGIDGRHPPQQQLGGCTRVGSMGPSGSAGSDGSTPWMRAKISSLRCSASGASTSARKRAAQSGPRSPPDPGWAGRGAPPSFRRGAAAEPLAALPTGVAERQRHHGKWGGKRATAERAEFAPLPAAVCRSLGAGGEVRYGARLLLGLEHALLQIQQQLHSHLPGETHET